MIVRFYPMILRLFLGTVTRVSGATLLVGMWQVVRSPSQYTRLALLLMMAVALGTFAASYRSTTQRSYEDRARFEAGADLRGTHSTRMIYGSGAELDENVEELAGVAAASATMRITGVQAFGGSASRQVTVLGVERDLADVAWYREDFADVPVHDLLQPLGGPVGVADVTLPEGTVGIELWVDTEVLRSDLTVTVRVRGGAGQYSTFELIDIDQHGWRKGEVLFEKPGVELQQPLSIVAVMLTPPSRRIRSADNAIFIDDIAAFNADGERTLVEDFEGGREWSGIPHPDQRAESLRISGENVHGGGHAARIGFVEEATKGRRGMFPSHVNIPLPVVASRRFVQESGIDVGETTFIEFSGGAVPVVVRAVYELFPTLGAVDGASIIANRDHLEDWGNTFQVLPGPLLGPNEVWVSLDEGGDADAVAGQLVHREYGNFNRTTSVSEALGRIQSNPLIAASGQGILLIAYVAVMGLVGAALLVSLWMAVQRRKVEFAVLRALGLARRQIFALLAFEYSIVGIVGLVTGGYLGRVVGRRMLSFLDVTETGGAVEPDFVLRTDWTFVAAGGVGVFVVFLAALLFATRVLAKMSEAEALRIE